MGSGQEGGHLAESRGQALRAECAPARCTQKPHPHTCGHYSIILMHFCLLHALVLSTSITPSPLSSCRRPKLLTASAFPSPLPFQPVPSPGQCAWSLGSELHHYAMYHCGHSPLVDWTHLLTQHQCTGAAICVRADLLKRAWRRGGVAWLRQVHRWGCYECCKLLGWMQATKL